MLSEGMVGPRRRASRRRVRDGSDRCSMFHSEPPDTERAVVRAAARRMAAQITIGCVLVVVVVAVLTFLVGPLLHPGSPADAATGDDDDALLRDGLLVAAAVGVLVAGLVGFLAARRAVRPLEEALELQRRFVADAGHELRTPLAVLHTRAQLLARRLPPADPARQVADQLLADSRVLGDIVEEMLASAQLATRPRISEMIDPAALVVDVVTSMKVLATGAGITLDTSAQGASMVRGSGSALRRALTALVDNALAHTPPGGHISVTTDDTARGVLLSVTDDGEGLSGQDPAGLTIRSARGQEAGTGARGERRFGLGLALAAEVAAIHGGSFTLTGLPSHGVRATLQLPAATDEHQ